MARPAPRARDLAVLLAAAVALTLLYGATSQDCVFGSDGAFLCEWATVEGSARDSYHNVLFHRVARAWDECWTTTQSVPTDPLAATKWFVALCGALGVAFTLGALRALRVALRPAVYAAVLLGVTPAHWFFATVVEVHALHFAICAGVAWIIAAAPWHRPLLATTFACLAIPWTYLSHQSAPALGLGWLALAQYARVRRAGGARFTLVQFFVVGAAMLAALALGQATTQWMRGLGFGLALGEMSDTVTLWQRSVPWTVLRDEIAVPLGVLIVLAVVGAIRSRREHRTDLVFAVASLFGPPAAFLLYWGIVEQGGYMVAPAIGLVIATGVLFERIHAAAPRAALVVAVVSILVQGALSVRAIDRHESRHLSMTDRATAVGAALDELGVDGPVVAARFSAPPMRVWRADCVEIDLLPTFTQNAASAEAWFATYADPLIALASQDGTRPFVLDRSYRDLDQHWRDVFREALTAFERRIAVRFEVEERAYGSRTLWLVRP